MQQKRWRNQRLNRFGVITLIVVLPFLSGCWMAVAAGAGAYGGYKMKEKGYTVQNPIAKKKSAESKSD